MRRRIAVQSTACEIHDDGVMFCDSFRSAHASSRRFSSIAGVASMWLRGFHEQIRPPSLLVDLIGLGRLLRSLGQQLADVVVASLREVFIILADGLKERRSA